MKISETKEFNVLKRLIMLFDQFFSFYFTENIFSIFADLFK